jgi:hypothetical protein
LQDNEKSSEEQNKLKQKLQDSLNNLVSKLSITTGSVSKIDLTKITSTIFNSIIDGVRNFKPSDLRKKSYISKTPPTSSQNTITKQPPPEPAPPKTDALQVSVDNSQPADAQLLSTPGSVSINNLKENTSKIFNPIINGLRQIKPATSLRLLHNKFNATRRNLSKKPLDKPTSKHNTSSQNTITKQPQNTITNQPQNQLQQTGTQPNTLLQTQQIGTQTDTPTHPQDQSQKIPQTQPTSIDPNIKFKMLEYNEFLTTDNYNKELTKNIEVYINYYINYMNGSGYFYDRSIGEYKVSYLYTEGNDKIENIYFIMFYYKNNFGPMQNILQCLFIYNTIIIDDMTNYINKLSLMTLQAERRVSTIPYNCILFYENSRSFIQKNKAINTIITNFTDIQGNSDISGFIDNTTTPKYNYMLYFDKIDFNTLNDIITNSMPSIIESKINNN